MIQRYAIEFESITTDNPNGKFCLSEDVEKLEAQNENLMKALWMMQTLYGDPFTSKKPIGLIDKIERIEDGTDNQRSS